MRFVAVALRLCFECRLGIFTINFDDDIVSGERLYKVTFTFNCMVCMHTVIQLCVMLIRKKSVNIYIIYMLTAM